METLGAVDIKENLRTISLIKHMTAIEPDFDDINSKTYEQLTPVQRAMSAAVSRDDYNDELLSDLTQYLDFKNLMKMIMTTKLEALDAVEVLGKLKRVSKTAINNYASSQSEFFELSE